MLLVQFRYTRFYSYTPFGFSRTLLEMCIFVSCHTNDSLFLFRDNNIIVVASLRLKLMVLCCDIF